jgi:hypothetical protein
MVFDDCLWLFKKFQKIVKIAELKDSKQKNGKLSLYPLKFGEAVKDFLKVKPEDKTNSSKSQGITTDSKPK